MKLQVRGEVVKMPISQWVTLVATREEFNQLIVSSDGNPNVIWVITPEDVIRVKDDEDHWPVFRVA